MLKKGHVGIVWLNYNRLGKVNPPMHQQCSIRVSHGFSHGKKDEKTALNQIWRFFYSGGDDMKRKRSTEQGECFAALPDHPRSPNLSLSSDQMLIRNSMILCIYMAYIMYIKIQ